MFKEASVDIIRVVYSWIVKEQQLNFQQITIIITIIIIVVVLVLTKRIKS